MNSGDAVQPRKRLSVVVIIPDGQDTPHVLENTLATARVIADEMILVDSRSIGWLPAVAERFDARLVTSRWKDDFSAVRNAGLAAATGDWILCLDCGERIEPEDAQSLREFIDQRADPREAYLLMTRLSPADPDGAAEQAAGIRLIPRHDDVRFAGRVRETLTESIAAAGLTPEVLRWHIHGDARVHDTEVKRRRSQRDLKLLVHEIQQQGQQPRLLVGLGDLYAALDEPQRAAEFYRTAIDHSAAGSTEQLEAYYGLLTVYGEINPGEPQLNACLQALESFPFDAQLLCALGSYLHRLGGNELACRAYETALQYGQTIPEVWHLCDVAEVAAACASLTLQCMDKDEEALSVLREAFDRHPESKRLATLLLNLYVKLGRQTEALALVGRLPGPVANVEALRSAIRGACQAAVENWTAALSYLATAYEAGCRDPICLRWLIATLMSTGNPRNAEPVLDEWDRLAGSDAEVAQYRRALTDAPQPAAAAGDAHVHVPLGAAAPAGDVQRDEAALRDHLNHHPDAHDVRRQLCALLVRQGRVEDAHRVFGSPQEPAPEGRPFADFMAGVAAANTGNWTVAEEILQKSYRAGFRDPALLYYLARCRAAAGRFDDAEPLLRDALAAAPEYAAAGRLLAEVLRQAGRAGAERLVVDRAAAPHRGPHTRQPSRRTATEPR